MRLLMAHSKDLLCRAVLFSSNEESQLRDLAQAVGAVGYIPKSEMANDFTNQVKRFLVQRPSSAPPGH